MKIVPIVAAFAAVFAVAEARAQVLTEYWCEAGDMSFGLIFDENVPKHLFLEVSVGEMMDQSLNKSLWLEGGWAGTAFYFSGDGFTVNSTGDGTPVLHWDGSAYECEGLEG